MKQSLRIVQFTLHDSLLACDVSQLEKILPMMTLDIVPNSLQHFHGLLNLAGTAIPVIDLASCLHIESSPYTEDTSILLTNIHNRQVGFIVDRIIDLCEIERNAIQQDEIFKGDNSPYLGSAIINDKTCLILQFEGLAGLITEDTRQNKELSQVVGKVAIQ